MVLSISQRIINRVVEEMIQNAQEMGDIVIVPNRYDVYIHADDFKDVCPLLDTLRQQIIQRLDSEIAKRNVPNRAKTALISIVNQVAGSQLLSRDKRFSRVDDEWYVRFEECAGKIHVGSRVFELEKGEIGVVKAFFSNKTQRGSSEYRTLVTIYDKFDTAKTTLLKKILPKPHLETHDSPSCLARLRYQYQGDAHMYEFRMVKDMITIGRGGESESVDLQLTLASERVSPTHLAIRRDKATGRFAVENFGPFGCTVNGKKIPQASAIPSQAQIALMELKTGSRLSLAGGEVVIDFLIGNR